MSRFVLLYLDEVRAVMKGSIAAGGWSPEEDHSHNTVGHGVLALDSVK